MEGFFVAVDIGATKTTVSVSSRQGILARVYQLTRKKGDRGTVPRQIDFLIGFVCEQARIDKGQISAVGISTASPFEKSGGYLALAAPNICGGLSRVREGIDNDWTEVPLEQDLRDKYPRLEIANDCTSAAVAERSFGAFSRSFTLPGTVNTDKIQAEHKNGVLSVTLPKAKEAQPRRIEVKGV